MDTFTISEMARRAGNLTVRTIRFYEEKRLLKPCSATSGGQKRYDEAALANLRRVLLLKRAGMSLGDIRQTIQQLEMKSTRGKAKQQAHAQVLTESKKKLLLYKQEISDLTGQIDRALANRDKCDNCSAQDCSGCGVLDKWTNFGYDEH